MRFVIVRTPLWTNLNDFIVGMADCGHLCSVPDVFKYGSSSLAFETLMRDMVEV